MRLGLGLGSQVEVLPDREAPSKLVGTAPAEAFWDFVGVGRYSGQGLSLVGECSGSSTLLERSSVIVLLFLLSNKIRFSHIKEETSFTRPK